MTSKYDDRLKDYTDVKERIRLFYERYPDGRLVTADVQLTTEPDGVPRVIVKALAYRTPDDPLPQPGWSWLILPGATSFTRGSEIENAETSAWGRAIGSLGIGIGTSVASTDEIDAKAGEADRPARKRPEPIESGPTTLTGTAAAGKSAPVDLEYRQGPPEQGPTLGFALLDERGHRTQVVAVGELATALWDSIAHDGARLHNVEVTVEGSLERVAWKKDGKDMPAYRRLTLSRITTPDFVLPVEDDLSDLPESWGGPPTPPEPELVA